MKWIFLFFVFAGVGILLENILEIESPVIYAWVYFIIGFLHGLSIGRIK
jgi:hypothetical protein